jgi:hypothetical protein
MARYLQAERSIGKGGFIIGGGYLPMDGAMYMRVARWLVLLNWPSCPSVSRSAVRNSILSPWNNKPGLSFYDHIKRNWDFKKK